ncbi:hypothetical protein ACT7DH_27945 [Bacillus pacificus]
MFLELAEQTLPVVADALKSLADAFSGLSPETQKAIGVVIAIVGL